MTVRAVFFDIGETLVDETRLWASRADWLGVPHLTLFAVLGGVIERGEHHHRALELVRPGLDHQRESATRAAAGAPAGFAPEDLYPDAIPCLDALRAEGDRLGLAGNQPAAAERTLRDRGLPLDILATAGRWGVEKPHPAFFAKLAETASLPPSQIADVGDRLDNDVLPAVAAGTVGVFLRRGPWGFLHADHPDAAKAPIRLNSRQELPAALARYRHQTAADHPQRKDPP